jgi:hypothetical protein
MLDLSGLSAPKIHFKSWIRVNKIRKITPAGVVTTLAGSGVERSEDGTGTEASFAYADGVAVDSSWSVYVADRGNNLIRKITISP